MIDVSAPKEGREQPAPAALPQPDIGGRDALDGGPGDHCAGELARGVAGVHCDVPLALQRGPTVRL